MAALHEQLLHGLRFILVDLTAERITSKFHKTTKIRDYAQKRFVFFVDSIKIPFSIILDKRESIPAFLLFQYDYTGFRADCTVHCREEDFP